MRGGPPREGAPTPGIGAGWAHPNAIATANAYGMLRVLNAGVGIIVVREVERRYCVNAARRIVLAGMCFSQRMCDLMESSRRVSSSVIVPNRLRAPDCCGIKKPLIYVERRLALTTDPKGGAAVGSDFAVVN